MNEDSSSGSSNSAKKPLSHKFRQWISRRFTHKVGEEIHNLIEKREEAEKPLTPEEKEFIAAVLRFKDVKADDVSVPRSDMVCVQAGQSFEEMVEIFVRSGHSRLPVCGRNLDDILGFITLKDIIRYIGNPADFRLDDVIRSCAFVPDSLPINRVLQQMRKNKVQIAVVLDEYGGTAGLATVKDILEELVGDLEDEHEREEFTMLTRLPEGHYRVDPRMPVEELEEETGLTLLQEKDVDFDTVGGLVLHVAGRVPCKGETFTLPGGHKITVLESDGRRLQKLKLIPTGSARPAA